MPTADPPDARTELARRQAAVVRALCGDDPPPEGFEPSHVERAAESLGRKRSRAACKMWPALTGALGERFDEHFTSYSATRPLPQAPEEDGFRFAQWLRSQRLFPDAAKLELAAWQVVNGFPLRLVVSRTTRSLALVYRTAGGARVLKFRWARPV